MYSKDTGTGAQASWQRTAKISLIVIGAVVGVGIAAVFIAYPMLTGINFWIPGIGSAFLAHWISRKLIESQSKTAPDESLKLLIMFIPPIIGLGIGFLVQWRIPLPWWQPPGGSIIRIIVAMGVVALGGVYLGRSLNTGIETFVEKWKDKLRTSLTQLRDVEQVMTKVGLASQNTMCPYCLSSNTIVVRRGDGGNSYYECQSRDCGSQIARDYVADYQTPRHVVSVVGFPGHGKTVYFASLFHELHVLADYWPGFYIFTPDERSLGIVRNNIKALEAGQLPEQTPKSFPVPTIVKFSHIPSLGDRFFLFYDTGGESYIRAGDVIDHARFVAQSHVVIFMLSLNDLNYDARLLHELLSTYAQGISELGGSTKRQHLLIVLSKGDTLEPKLGDYPDVWRYLREGSSETLKGDDLTPYIGKMDAVSSQLRKFLINEVKAAQFVNFAQDRFRSVEFSIISSLGAAPDGMQLHESVTPKRIIDPLIWVASKS